MTDTALPPGQDGPTNPPSQEQGACLRCGTPGPVNDDGFCDKCEKALEQACL